MEIKAFHLTRIYRHLLVLQTVRISSPLSSESFTNPFPGLPMQIGKALFGFRQ
jgi:hypothetical protein